MNKTFQIQFGDARFATRVFAALDVDHGQHAPLIPVKFTYWENVPNGDFPTLEEAEAGMQSLVDVCGWDADTMRIVEIND